MDIEKIREEFLKSDVRDCKSVFDHNDNFRWQYVDYLEQRYSSAHAEIEKLELKARSAKEAEAKVWDALYTQETEIEAF